VDTHTAILRSKYEKNTKPFLVRFATSADVFNKRIRLVFVVEHVCHTEKQTYSKANTSCTLKFNMAEYVYVNLK